MHLHHWLLSSLVVTGLVACSAAPVRPLAEPAQCKSAGEMHPTVAPPSHYRAAADCARKGRFEDGAWHVLLANAYVAIDTRRVRESAFAGDEGRAYLAQQLTSRQSTALAQATSALARPDRLAGTCQQLRAIGAPAYRPDYLLTRKDRDARVPGQPLVTDFVLANAWDAALATPLGCPRAGSD